MRIVMYYFIGIVLYCGICGLLALGAVFGIFRLIAAAGRSNKNLEALIQRLIEK
jgi:hypothetical protein